MNSNRSLVDIVTENRDEKQIVTTVPPEKTEDPQGFFEINEQAAYAWSSQRERDLTIQYPHYDYERAAERARDRRGWAMVFGIGTALLTVYLLKRKRHGSPKQERKAGLPSTVKGSARP